MDYTDLPRVKEIIDTVENSDDDLLERCITAASRGIDRHCTGALQSDDYFTLSTVTDEECVAMVDTELHLVAWPRKAAMSSVSAFAYRYSPLESWQSVNTTYLVMERHRVVAWLTVERKPIFVKLTYSGGLAATIDDLPADLVEAATVLAVRYYREAKSGLTDTIGVAELGTLQYTKAIPARVKQMLIPYKRMAPW